MLIFYLLCACTVCCSTVSFSCSRISALTEQLERLFSAEKSEASRDLDQLRYVTLKMYQLLQTQGIYIYTIHVLFSTEDILYEETLSGVHDQQWSSSESSKIFLLQYCRGQSLL